MKKFFALAAVVAVALTSCVTTTEIPDPAGEISFEAYNFKPQSRVVYGPIEDADGDPATKTNYPEKEHFGVYAFINTDAVNNYMNNAEILLDDEELEKDGAWRSINPRYYWPKGGKLTFVAYSPYVENNAPSADRTTGISFTGYTTTANLNEQIDLMATDLIPEVESYRTASVPVVFHHLLSQVGFTAQYDTATTPNGAIITLDRVVLSNVKSKGTYTAGAWAASEENKLDYNFVSAGSENAQTLTDEAQPVLPKLVANATNALVIPQDGRAGQGDIVVTIDYTITYEGTDAKDVVTGKEYKIPAPWEKGKKYIYAITIGVGQEITFTPKVSDWTAGEGGSITVG